MLIWIHPNDSWECKKICSHSACVTHQRLVLNSICHLFRRWTRPFWAASNIHSNWYVCVLHLCAAHTEIKVKWVVYWVVHSIPHHSSSDSMICYNTLSCCFDKRAGTSRKEAGGTEKLLLRLLCPRLILYSAFSDTTCHYRLSNQIYRAANAGLLSRLA